MPYLIDNGLKFTIVDLEIFRSEALGGMVYAHDEKDDETFKKCFKEYERIDRLITMGYEMLIEGKLKEWDWKWLADGGRLCRRDWYEDWFKKDLEKDGVSKEEYDKKWGRKVEQEKLSKIEQN